MGVMMIWKSLQNNMGKVVADLQWDKMDEILKLGGRHMGGKHSLAINIGTSLKLLAIKLFFKG